MNGTTREWLPLILTAGTLLVGGAVGYATVASEVKTNTERSTENTKKQNEIKDSVARMEERQKVIRRDIDKVEQRVRESEQRIIQEIRRNAVGAGPP